MSSVDIVQASTSGSFLGGGSGMISGKDSDRLRGEILSLETRRATLSIADSVSNRPTTGGAGGTSNDSIPSEISPTNTKKEKAEIDSRIADLESQLAEAKNTEAKAEQKEEEEESIEKENAKKVTVQTQQQTQQTQNT